MPRLRHLAAAGVVAAAAVCAFAAPGALASRLAGSPLPSCTPALPQVVQNAHFQIWYSDDPTVSGSITQTQAGTVLAAAERSYASYTGSGFPTPEVGGSGKTELYIMDLSSWNLSSIYCAGSVVVDSASVTGDSMDFTIGVDVFTQVEYAIGTPINTPSWILNGPASWASWRALGYPAASIADIGPFDMALDCDTALDKANCSANGYENLGESRWPFYEYLAEKYGPLFMVDVLNATNAAGGNGLVGLQNAIAAKGSTLGAEYGAYAAKLLSGGWTASTLNAATIPVSGSAIQTGTSSGAIPSQSFGINHLATKFVEIDRGDGDGSQACYAATLTLNVQIPAGVTSQPTFYWAAGGSSPVPLTVSGSTATATVPWDTCLWHSHGYLSLPNTSLVDGTSFVVSGTLNVDFTTPATSATPPSPASPFGTPVAASSFSSAPTISLLGPKVTVMTPDDDEIRIAVVSSGFGILHATLGSLALVGASGPVPNSSCDDSLSPGASVCHFTLPAGVLSALRLAGAAGLPLALIPLDANGATHGATVTTRVVYQPSASTVSKTTKTAPAKAKSKAKAKTKAKPKPKHHK